MPRIPVKNNNNNGVFMECSICLRDGRGFCWVSPSDCHERSNRLFRRFCSMECQRIHAGMIKHFNKKQTGSYYGMIHIMRKETDIENRAITAVFPSLEQYLSRVGMDKTISNYTRDEVVDLIKTIVFAYSNALRALTCNDYPFSIDDDDVPF